MPSDDQASALGPDDETRSTMGGAFASVVEGPGMSERHAAARVRSRLFGEPAPSPLPRYTLKHVIGRGAMGEVWAAYDPQLDRPVAIKIVRTRTAGTDDDLARLGREARSLARLSHPNVVGVFDLGRYDEPGRQALFIVMELVDGESLSSWLARSHSTAEILGVFAQAAEGLAAAHGVGLVHRDFKPANVLVGRDGRTRVGDFGLARLVDERVTIAAAEIDPAPAELARTPAGGLTETGTVMGTPLYMAPEQHAGAAVDARTDQYAFCVALFEALWGAYPFAGNMARLALAKSDGVVAIPRVREHEVPAALETAILRGLRPDPGDRWPDMTGLVAACRRAGRARPRGRLLVAAASAVVVVGAAAQLARAAPCDSVAAADRHWSAGHRASVRESLLAASPIAVDARMARLDAWRDAYAAAVDEACRVDAARTTERWDCLSSSGQAFDAATRAIADGAVSDAATIDELISGVASASSCSDKTEASPIPEAIRGDVEAIRAELAQAGVTLRVRAPDGLAATLAAHDAATRLGYGPLLVEAWTSTADAYNTVEMPGASVEAYERCYLAAVEIGADVDAHRCAHHAAMMATQSGDASEAEAWLTRAEAALSRFTPTPQQVADCAALRGGLWLSLGRLDDAIAESTRSLAACTTGDCPGMTGTSFNLAGALELADRLEEGRQQWVETVSLAEREFGEHADVTRRARLRVLGAAIKTGDAAGARPALEREIATFEAEPSPPVVSLATAWGLHAEAWDREDNPAQALASAERSLHYARVAFSGSPPRLGSALVRVAVMRDGADDDTGALELFAEALPLVVDNPILHGGVLVYRSDTYLETGNHAAALADAEAAVALFAEVLAPSHHRIAHAALNRGQALVELGRCAEALPSIDRALAIYEHDDAARARWPRQGAIGHRLRERCTRPPGSPEPIAAPGG